MTFSGDLVVYAGEKSYTCELEPQDTLELSPWNLHLRVGAIPPNVPCSIGLHIHGSAGTITCTKFENVIIARKPPHQLSLTKIELHDIAIEAIIQTCSVETVVFAGSKLALRDVDCKVVTVERSGDSPRSHLEASDSRIARIAKLSHGDALFNGCEVQALRFRCATAGAIRLRNENRFGYVALPYESVGTLEIADGIIGALQCRSTLVVNRHQFGLGTIDRPVGFHEHSFKTKSHAAYHLAARSARIRGDRSAFAKLTYLAALEQSRIMKWPAKAVFRLFALICGCGYKPLRTAAAAAIVVLCSAALYWLAPKCFGRESFLQTHHIIGALEHNQAGERDSRDVDLPEAMYFSVVTFTTVGYGDMAPTGGLVRFVAALEALFGAASMGLFLSSLIIRYAGPADA